MVNTSENKQNSAAPWKLFNQFLGMFHSKEATFGLEKAYMESKALKKQCNVRAR